MLTAVKPFAEGQHRNLNREAARCYPEDTAMRFIIRLIVKFNVAAALFGVAAIITALRK